MRKNKLQCSLIRLFRERLGSKNDNIWQNVVKKWYVVMKRGDISPVYTTLIFGTALLNNGTWTIFLKNQHRLHYKFWRAIKMH
jgi:hypothetical protein